MDEFYLTTLSGRDVETFHYQIKYAKQRDLLVELILFAKRQADKKAGLTSERMRNPYYQINPDENPEKIVQNVLGNRIPEAKSLRVLTNDRISPPKQLFNCEVYTKSTAFLSSQRKLWFHLGTSQILLST